MQSRLVSELLGSALPHIPSLGFTVQAIQSGARQSGIASSATVSDLFPSSSITAQKLLECFDQHYWEKFGGKQSGQGLRGKDEQEQVKAYQDAVAMLEGKLVATIPVRERLPDALASLVNTSLPTLPISVPNPSSILHRAYSITDEALHKAGWTGALSTDWYTTRLALTNSFMLAELHMISPDQLENQDATPSLQLYRRLSSGSYSQDTSKKKSTFPPAKNWAHWGAQGWLGILRSYGL